MHRGGRLAYKTNVDNFSLCPFLFAGASEDERHDYSRKDAEDVEDGEHVAPQTADNSGGGTHPACRRLGVGGRWPTLPSAAL